MRGSGIIVRHRKGGAISLACSVGLLVAACGSSSTPATSSGGSSGSNTVPNVTVSSFTVDLATVMAQFKPLTQFATKGSQKLLVGVIMPDTTSSTRYVDFDAPYLKTAFTAAGYSPSQFRIENAQGSDSTMLDDATADINLGAKILIVDPIDNPTGIAVAQLAASRGVTLLAYDRAIFQGHNYYVSFDNVLVGNLIGMCLESCITAWNVTSPKIFTLDGGEDVETNSIAFATGYNKTVWNIAAKSVPAGTTNSLGYTLVGENYAPGWDNTKGGQIFQQEFTTHRQINATIEANDGLANAVITDLKGAGVKPKTIPTTGQDATAQGMANILQGWQCGTVYKPIYKEAGDAVALATILLAGDTPPSALVNATTVDPKDSTITEPASLSTPVWVTAANMESTVVSDGFDTATAICAIAGATACSAAGIH
jgi:D-xylose transport system substrate-binding protein